MTPEEDINKIRNSISDPKRNAFLPFDPNDPIQKSLSNVAQRRKDDNLERSGKQITAESKVKSESIKNTLTSQKSKKILQPHVNCREPISEAKSHSAAKKVTFTSERLMETDHRFGRLIMGARSKKDRDEHGQIVLEGKNLIVDALSAGAKLQVLYFTKHELMEDFPVEFLNDVQVYQVQYRHLKLWSDVETPQGLLGIFEMPPPDNALKPAVNPIPLTLICDSVRDGGNMGTLIRSAAAVGCHRFIALKGCVDIWNGKVLRSAAGSHFRVPLVSNVTWPQIPSLLPPADNVKVFLADSNQVTEEYRQSLSGTLEAVAEIEQLENVSLEKEWAMDSGSASDDSEFENDTITTKDKQYRMDENEDLSYKNFKVLNAYRKAPLPVEFYDRVDYTDKHAVLVVSGETSGVSLPSRKLAYDHYGACVTIPMEAEVESLNCAVAGSIIMYEISKQYRNVKAASQQQEE